MHARLHARLHARMWQVGAELDGGLARPGFMYKFWHKSEQVAIDPCICQHTPARNAPRSCSPSQEPFADCATYRADTRAHVHARLCMCTCTRAHVHACAHTCTRVHVHAHTHAWMPTSEPGSTKPRRGLPHCQQVLACVSTYMVVCMHIYLNPCVREAFRIVKQVAHTCAYLLHTCTHTHAQVARRAAWPRPFVVLPRFPCAGRRLAR